MSYPKQIGPFKLYEKEPNDICFGAIYTLEVTLPLLYYKKRTVRVYLPEDFDQSKKYPVLFMSDGQNIVDKYTSAYGAWEIDKRQHELLAQGYKSFIVVGIDCPKGPIERAIEYSFPFLAITNWESGNYEKTQKYEFESHMLYKYIAEDLFPLIKNLFPISDNRDEIACGGSSMGGVFALSLLLSYPEVFGCALCFSPGYFLYDRGEVKKYIDARLSNLDNKHRMFFYSGNVGFEHAFLEDTERMYNYFIDNGFSKEKVGLLVDLEAEHNEYCWSLHFNEAIKFWQKL